MNSLAERASTVPNPSLSHTVQTLELQRDQALSRELEAFAKLQVRVVVVLRQPPPSLLPPTAVRHFCRNMAPDFFGWKLFFASHLQSFFLCSHFHCTSFAHHPHHPSFFEFHILFIFSMMTAPIIVQWFSEAFKEQMSLLECQKWRPTLQHMNNTINRRSQRHTNNSAQQST